MALPLIVWGAVAAASTLGGIVYWGRERAKLTTGDTAFVPPAALTVTTPLAGALSLPSLAGLGGLVRVENITRTKTTATGTAGKEVGASVALSFPVNKAVTIERKGQQFANPEKV